MVGLVGIALEEARLFGPPSETLLLLFAAMIGLPLVLRVDEAKRTSGSTNGPGSSDGGNP